MHAAGSLRNEIYIPRWFPYQMYVRSLCLDRQRRSVSPCDQSPIYQGNDPIASRNLLAVIDEANFVEISMLRLGSSFSVP